jgi:hypothetical protein
MMTRKLWEVEKGYIMRSFITCLLHQILYWSDEVKEDEMGRSCSTQMRNAYKIVISKPEETMCKT